MNEEGLVFLSLENILQIHADSIAHEGGSAGLRDRNLLESAAAMPQATFAGHYLHPSLAEMVAAYLFHLCQNHAFVDGNKRTAAFSTVLFLYLNGIPEENLPAPQELETLTLEIASSRKTKAEVTEWMRNLNLVPPTQSG